MNYCKKCEECHDDGLSDYEECPYYGDPCGCNHPNRGYGESIEDIVREMREKNPREEYPAEYGYGEVPNEMKLLADRIESAAKELRKSALKWCAVCDVSELREEVDRLRAALANARNCEYAANVGCECHGMRQVREFESEVK